MASAMSSGILVCLREVGAQIGQSVFYGFALVGVRLLDVAERDELFERFGGGDRIELHVGWMAAVVAFDLFPSRNSGDGGWLLKAPARSRPPYLRQRAGRTAYRTVGAISSSDARDFGARADAGAGYDEDAVVAVFGDGAGVKFWDECGAEMVGVEAVIGYAG